jgi:NifU-like protein involved in Fe-S cluster formation
VSPLDHNIQNPHKMYPLEGADIVGQAGTQGAGPFMRMFFRLKEESVEEATFVTYNCPIAIACGSWVTGWAEGRTREFLARLEPGDVELLLGGLPLGKEHCAALAVNSLKDALRQWQMRSEVN